MIPDTCHSIPDGFAHGKYWHISELSTAIILYTGKTKTLTVAIYTEVIRGNYGTAAALSTIMTILTVISLLAFSKLNGGKDISL